MCSCFNKASLIKLLVSGGNYSDTDICRMATCEETCFKMTTDEWLEVAELQSTQEEPDIGKLDRQSLDADATSTICCLGIVGLPVCEFLQADKLYVHSK